MLYEPDARSQLSELGLLTPYSLKIAPLVIQQSQSLERLPLGDLELEIRQVDAEAKTLAEELRQTESDLEKFKEQIVKYDRQISSLKQ